MATHKKSEKELTEDTAWAKILRLLTAREHSTESLRQRLLRDGYDEAVVETVIDKGIRTHIIDNNRYGEALVRTRIASGKGLEPVKDELAELGIDIDSLESYQDYVNSSDEGEIERAYELLCRRPPRSKNLREGAFRKLVTNGFSTSVASTVAKRWSEQKTSGE